MIIKKKNNPSIKINKKNAYKYTCYQHFNDGMILPWTMIMFKFFKRSRYCYKNNKMHTEKLSY